MERLPDGRLVYIVKDCGKPGCGHTVGPFIKDGKVMKDPLPVGTVEPKG